MEDGRTAPLATSRDAYFEVLINCAVCPRDLRGDVLQYVGLTGYGPTSNKIVAVASSDSTEMEMTAAGVSQLRRFLFPHDDAQPENVAE